MRLVQEHQKDLWRYLRYLGCDPTQADELLQDTFLQVWQRPFEDRGPAAVSSYLRTVARHLFLDAVRRRRARPVLEDLEVAEAVWCEYARDDGGEVYLDALRNCLKQLASRAHRALELCYRDKMSRRAIAADLSMTADGVKTLLRRSRNALRDCIERGIGS